MGTALDELDVKGHSLLFVVRRQVFAKRVAAAAVAGPVAKQVVQRLDDLGMLGVPRLSRVE